MRKFEEIRQHKVAIKAHEKTDIQSRREEPTGGRYIAA
jgi:hypothetical protein